MTFEEAQIQLSELRRDYKTPYADAEKSQIDSLHFEIKGRYVRPGPCKNKYHDAVQELLYYLKKHGKMAEKSQYRLKPGVILQMEGSSIVYDNSNLTDEIAAAFLKKYPKAVSRFEITPGSEKSKTSASGKDTGKQSEELQTAKAENEQLKTDIDALTTENEDLKKQVEDLTTENEQLKATARAASGDKGEEQSSETESQDEKDEDPAEDASDEKAVEINEKIKAVVAEQLAAGKSKAAIKTSLAGKIIEGVKLTQKLVGIYIKAIESEEQK
jgi:hypothetical protein